MPTAGYANGSAQGNTLFGLRSEYHPSFRGWGLQPGFDAEGKYGFVDALELEWIKFDDFLLV